VKQEFLLGRAAVLTAEDWHIDPAIWFPAGNPDNNSEPGQRVNTLAAG
jgi:hypothetical protein